MTERAPATGPRLPGAATGRDLLRPTLRSLPWLHMATGGGLAAALMLVTFQSQDLGSSGLVDRLRASAVLLAVGVAGVLDDPTRPHLDGTPVSLVARQALRLGIVAAVVAACWAALLLAAGNHPAAGRGDMGRGALPVVALSVVLVALVTATLAVAAAVTRARGGSGAIPAAAAAVAIPVLALTVPRVAAQSAGVDVTMFPSYSPGAADPLWLAAHQRWLAIALAASVVLAWALPGPRARRGLRRSRPGPRPEPDPRLLPSTGRDDEGTSR